MMGYKVRAIVKAEHVRAAMQSAAGMNIKQTNYVAYAKYLASFLSKVSFDLGLGPDALQVEEPQGQDPGR